MNSVKKMHSGSLSIRYISSNNNEIENILIEKKAEDPILDNSVDSSRSPTPPESRWSILEGLKQRLRKNKTETLKTPSNIEAQVVTSNHQDSQENENLSTKLNLGYLKKDNLPEISDKLLENFEVEHAVDCLEELPFSDLECQQIQQVTLEMKSLSRRVYELWTNFYNKNAKILNQISIGLILSLIAYMSIIFVFGFLFGILFLLIFGYGDNTRAKFLKKADKIRNKDLTLEEHHQHTCTHKSWFRLYPEKQYDPVTYHVSKTLSIHLQLKENILMIAYTPYKMSTKMMFSNTAKKLQNSRFFCHFRQIDLRQYDVYLLPNGLKNERIWNKKYPICLKKRRDSLVEKTESDSVTTEEAGTSEFSAISQDVEEDDLCVSYDDCKLVLDILQIDETDSNIKKSIKCHYSTYHKTNKDSFFIFAKTNREKECWYRKLSQASYTDEESKKQLSKFENFVSQVIKIDKNIDDVLNSDLIWINAIIGRVAYHFINDNKWIEFFEQLIQTKLDALKVANFIDDVTISKLNFGQSVPYVTKAYKPIIDDEGLWIDLGIHYEGFVGFLLTTKINLIKTNKKDDFSIGTDSERECEDDEDSVESSSEEEFPDFPVTSNPNVNSPTKSRRFIDFMDRVTTSKYFQNATEYKYVKMALEGVSKTELKLEISLLKLEGVLVLHIPNPKCNRIWYGFRENPQLILAAKPAVGERFININHITTWIENKLCQEFQKYFVLPNMDDLEVFFLDLDKFVNTTV